MSVQQDAVAIRPSYRIRENEPAGVIRMEVEGFFDVGTLRRHFADNHMVVREWRARQRSIRVLIDAVKLMPHSPDGQAIVQASTAAIYEQSDKVAVLVSSGLVKMQMRRALKQGDIIEFFTRECDALEWLAEV